MLLAVFSDSHGNSKNMIAAVAKHQPDAVIFLGDGVADAEKLARANPALPVRILRGNCDHDATDTEETAVFEFGGVKIFASHGHIHGVRFGMDRFCNSVYFSGCALGMYGHTHRAVCQEIGGMTFFNPGSIGNKQAPTYGLIEAENGTFVCRIHDFSETEI